MKRLWPCILFFLLCAAAAAADDKLPAPFGPLHILEVGINGEHAVNQPSAVRLQVENQTQTRLQLRLRLHSATQYGVDATDFTSDVSLGPGERREVELPVLLFGNVEVSALTPDDRTLAYDNVPAEKLGAPNPLGTVLLLCDTDQACKSAQEQAQFSGSMEERVEKNKNLHFITLRSPRAHWWPYTVAHTIVVAESIAAYTPEQRTALEDFVRRGGRLVLLERELGDADFLRDYRQGIPGGAPVPVSRGVLWRFASLNAQTLGGAFAGSALRDVAPQALALYPPFDDDSTWFRRHAAIQFKFPRLRWLLLWLTLYVIVIGIVNFTILRRLRKLEWGWLTMTAGALLFAGGFFIASSAQRPEQFTLDDLATYSLDGHSANAYAEYGLRISAPQRREVVVRVDDPAAISTASRRSAPSANLGAEIRVESRPFRPELKVHLGPPRLIPIPLLRWSFSDLTLEGTRRLAGTVREIAPGRLHNETGVAFRDAILVDFAASKVWKLGAMAPGGEVALANTPEQPLFENEQQKRAWNAIQGGSFSLIDLARSQTNMGRNARRVLFALSDGPTAHAELLGTPYAHRNHALFVVVFE